MVKWWIAGKKYLDQMKTLRYEIRIVYEIKNLGKHLEFFVICQTSQICQICWHLSVGKHLVCGKLLLVNI